MPQFDVTTFPTQIFWLLVCFLFLCVVMRLHIVPRLATVLETREQRIQEDWNEAKTLISTCETLRQENLDRLAQARGNAHVRLHQILQEIHHQKASRIAVLEGELASKTKTFRDNLENETQAIIENIEPLVTQVVKTTSLRILGKTLTAAEAKKNVQYVIKKGKSF